MSLNRAIEAIAESMWDLIKPTAAEDWAWCVTNEPSTADELRFRARCVIERNNLVVVENSAKPNHQGHLDLRFKEAFVGTGEGKQRHGH